MKCRTMFPYNKAIWPKFDRLKYNNSLCDYFKVNKKPRGPAYKRLAELEANRLMAID